MLISPRMSMRPMDSEFKRLLSPSLSLVVIASLTAEPHQVRIVDENLEKINYDDVPDIVGITVNVDTSSRAAGIAKKFRQKGSKVVFGGIHASANPDEMLEHCDSVVIGEAEEVWHKLIDDATRGELKKKYFNNGITNLKNYPQPNWNYIRKQSYLYNNIIITSRGCPFKCDFCYNSSEYVSNPFRNRPIEHVVQEISHHETKQIMIIDDNFIGNLKWTQEFIEQIKYMGLTWHAAVSADLVHHEDLIDSFAESGCKSLFIGFESINQKSISSVHKKQNNIDNYEKLISMLHERGIMVNASLVFGFDDDDNSVFAETLDWLVVNKIETMTAHILTPYPGTKLYSKLISEGRIIDYDTRRYNTSNVVFQPKQMTCEELRKGYLWLYKQFYSMKNIIRRRPDNRSITASYFMFNFIYRKFGKTTSLLGKLGLMNKIGQLGRRISYGID
jgi:radical SAM superfamily enzyme YgiQ (UPF0313 family)